MLKFLEALTPARAIAGAVLLALIGWGAWSAYDGIRDRGYRQGVDDTRRSERLCLKGTVCAELAIARARAQRQVVDEELQKAADAAARAARMQLEQEQVLRAAADARAASAAAAAATWQHRYLDATRSSSSCAAFDAAPVPCPVE